MSLTPRKDEVAALVELLDLDWDSPEALAKAFLKRSFELIQQRTTYLVAVPNGQMSSVYGVFATAADAKRAGDASMFGRAFYVRPLWGTPELQENQEAGARLCKTCNHPKGLHDHPKTAGRCVQGVGPSKSIQPCTCTQFE